MLVRMGWSAAICLGAMTLAAGGIRKTVSCTGQAALKGKVEGEAFGFEENDSCVL